MLMKDRFERQLSNQHKTRFSSGIPLSYLFVIVTAGSGKQRVTE